MRSALVPGLAFETFLDVVADEERRAGLTGVRRARSKDRCTSRRSLEKGEARLDQRSEKGEVLFMDGQVNDLQGKPIPGAIVEVWHANTKGGYSFFDPSQSRFNLRRSIETNKEARYRFRTIMPVGYGCPPDGPTQELLTALGRHGNRPAHIHFFVSAPGYRKLTTQINISDDHLPFATTLHFATRDELIPELVRRSDKAEIKDHGLDATIHDHSTDFVLHREAPESPRPDRGLAITHRIPKQYPRAASHGTHALPNYVES
jgi:catechol 1,2-dioxygenase